MVDINVGVSYSSASSSNGRRLTFVSIVLLMSLGFGQSAFAQATNIIINEVDADQVSTDAAEFVELYDGGSGNTDLSGLSIVLYNGSDNLSYIAFDLDGQSTGGDGYFVLCGNAANVTNCDLDVSPDTNLIQNGADAVVLLVGDAANYPNDTAQPADGDIVDAIVYDTNDADAAGLLPLLNAGQPQVNEGGGGNSTAHSNQRCANGTGGARNTDSYTQAVPSPGTANCVIVEPPRTTDVIINEVDADQVSTDSAEFVELYDGGAGNTSLNGLSIVLYNGSDDQSYVAFDLDGQSTDANGYFVLCGNAANVANCDLDVSPDTNLIQNGADAVVLLFGDAVNYPNDTALPADGDIVDAIVYDTNDSDDAGILVLLNASQPQINEGGGGDSTTHSNQRCSNGSGGARNTITYTQAAPTPGADNTCAAPPIADVIINEVDADQASTDSAEFVELYDGGVGNTSLTGLSIVLYNGSDDQSYIAFDLDGQSTGGDGYFVLCGNAANVANCDLDVSPDTNLIQNGADAVVLLVGDAVNYPNDTALPIDDDIVDAIVYDTNDSDDAGILVLLNAGQPQINEGGGGNSTADSNQRCDNGSGGARNTDTYTQALPSPGADNTCVIVVPPPPFGQCFDPATRISEVQGSGLVSPLNGNIGVIIEGIVVGDFQASNQLNGFFLQEEDVQADADLQTSEGIFVYDPGFGTDVLPGNVVRVQGDVTEFFGLTELNNVSSLAVCGSGNLPTPVTVTLPVSAITEFEAWEGMRVTLPHTLYVSGNFTLGRYGEVDLAVDAPLDNPTNVVDPGGAAMALSDLNNRSRIQLDDGSNVENPLPLPPYLGDGNTLRTGDSVAEGLTAVLSYSHGTYELQPIGPVNFTRVNERSVPPEVGGAVRVASFNVLNYFTTFGSRGAGDANEFMRQHEKLVAAITKLDAHVVGVIEIENASANGPIANLVDGLNAAVGAGTYDYIRTGAIGTDAIRVGLIYQPAAVSPVNAFAVLDSSVDPTFIDTKNRPVLAQSFAENNSGEVFTVAVNHFKSKGSNCDSIGDPDANDGQGNCNLVRTDAALALVNWLATDPTGSEFDSFLIIGDLNAYSQEDPVTAIKLAGYVDLVKDFVGLGVADGAYSFNFMGESGSLDHALSNPGLGPRSGFDWALPR